MRTDGTSATVIFLLGVTLMGLLPALASGDDGGIDKVYHPYVQAMEQEIGLRLSAEEGRRLPPDDRQILRLGYGRALNDNWLGELYLLGERSSDEALSSRGYEVELLWQMSEQGKYFVDSGLLFEYENLDSGDSMAFVTSLLLEQDWGRWSGTANLSVEYEFGSMINNELESATALQLRYRYARYLEPALEFYSGENVRGLGPVLLGDLHAAPGRKLHWEVGMIAGLINRVPDRTWRLLLEYEF